MIDLESLGWVKVRETGLVEKARAMSKGASSTNKPRGLVANAKARAMSAAGAAPEVPGDTQSTIEPIEEDIRKLQQRIAELQSEIAALEEERGAAMREVHQQRLFYVNAARKAQGKPELFVWSPEAAAYFSLSPESFRATLQLMGVQHVEAPRRSGLVAKARAMRQP